MGWNHVVARVRHHAVFEVLFVAAMGTLVNHKEQVETDYSRTFSDLYYVPAVQVSMGLRVRGTSFSSSSVLLLLRTCNHGKG